MNLRFIEFKTKNMFFGDIGIVKNTAGLLNSISFISRGSFAFIYYGVIRTQIDHKNLASCVVKQLQAVRQGGAEVCQGGVCGA